MLKFVTFIIFVERLPERDKISAETTMSKKKKGRYSLFDLYIRNDIIPNIYIQGYNIYRFFHVYKHVYKVIDPISSILIYL